MDKIVVQAPSGSYNIHFGPGIWAEVEQFARGYDQALVVSDGNVAPLYGHRLPFPKCVLEPWEETKSFRTIEVLVDDWAERGLNRYSLVIALGGGVIGDLVGLAASVFRRGIAYVQIPTTLLAQVDSGVGGKTGINTAHGKNLVGTFYQPWGVFIDPVVLRTLPEREITNGLGEVLKYGIIKDRALFEALGRHIDAFYDVDLEFVGPAVRRCVEIKGEIVAADETDWGPRHILNHGHTFGHAIEWATGYNKYNHGEAVLMGMVLEARLAHRLGMLLAEELMRIEEVLRRVRLEYSFAHLDRDGVIEGMLQDKKNRQGCIAFMLPREIGSVEEVLLGVEEVEKYWEEVTAQ